MMKRLVIGGLAALAIGLAAAPVAQAHPCSPDPVCHEFDWAIPYYDAFDRHGIGDLAYDLGIPMMNEVDLFCRGKASRENIRDIPTNWDDRRLSDAEVDKIIVAAYDVCPERAEVHTKNWARDG